MILHAQLNRNLFYYIVHYAQFIHDIIPVKDLKDDTGSPTTPYFLATKLKPHVRHFRVFGYPAVFKSMIFPQMERGQLIDTLNREFVVSLLVFPLTLLDGSFMYQMHITPIAPWTQFLMKISPLLFTYQLCHIKGR